VPEAYLVTAGTAAEAAAGTVAGTALPTAASTLPAAMSLAAAVGVLAFGIAAGVLLSAFISGLATTLPAAGVAAGAATAAAVGASTAAALGAAFGAALAAHLDQAVVERRAAAHVGQRLAGHLVAVAPVGRKLAPPDRGGHGDARPYAVADDGTGVEFAASVEDAHRVSSAMPACRGVGGMRWTAGDFSCARKRGELAKLVLRKLRAGGVIRASGNSCASGLCRHSRGAMKSGRGRGPGRRASGCRTRTCRKASGSHRRRTALALRQVQAGVTVGLELLPRQAGEARIAPVEGLAAEVLRRCRQSTASLKPIPGQATEQFGVRQRLAERRDRRLVDLDVQMAVGLVDVELFHVAGGRQQDVGVVGGVGLEEVVDDGEQVVAGEAAHHLARLRGDRHRIAVVDEQRLDRRLRVQQVVADGAHVDRSRRRVGIRSGRSRAACRPGSCPRWTAARRRRGVARHR
jgi:hypothetical protein